MYQGWNHLLSQLTSSLVNRQMKWEKTWVFLTSVVPGHINTTIHNWQYCHFFHRLLFIVWNSGFSSIWQQVSFTTWFLYFSKVVWEIYSFTNTGRFCIVILLVVHLIIGKGVVNTDKKTKYIKKGNTAPWPCHIYIYKPTINIYV